MASSVKSGFGDKHLEEKLSNETTDGIAFCFLPLPLHTGFPFHVNGHFSVDRARRTILDNGVSKHWNESLARFVLVRAMCAELLFLRSIVDGADLTKCSLGQPDCLKLYECLFPMYENANNKFWQFLLKAFYETMYAKQFALFPHVSDKSESKTSQQNQLNSCPEKAIQWVHLAQGNSDLTGGVFNTSYTYTYKDSEYFNKSDAKRLTSFLQQADIKVLASSKMVRENLDKAIPQRAVCVTPEYILQVLRSDRISINTKVEHSTFKTIDIFQSVLKFVLLSEQSGTEMESLPLNFTNDGVVRTFNSREGVFCTEWCDLLPASAEKFIHRTIVSLLHARKDLYNNNIIKVFKVNDLCDLLPDSLNPSVFKTGSEILWDVKNNNPVSKEYIRKIFLFVLENSLTESDSKQYSSYLRGGVVDVQKFRYNVNQLCEWSLLPCLTTRENIKAVTLLPIKQSHRLLYYETSQSEINDISKKMSIPTIDESVFIQPSHTGQPICSKSAQVLIALKHIMASSGNPVGLLKCLYYYRERLLCANININDAKYLLQFFKIHLKQLTNELSELKNIFSSLPWFETLTGQLAETSKAHKLIIVQESDIVPKQGLDELMRLNNLLFLKEEPSLEKIYVLLNIPVVSVLEFYAETIMPLCSQLPKETIIFHIEVLKQKFLRLSGFEENNHWCQIVKILRSFPFISLEQGIKCADEFYDEDDLVFKCMLGKENFLPKPLRTPGWKAFLAEIGFHRSPTPQMILSYAKDIATEAAENGLADLLRQKSETVCDFILESKKNFFDQATLSELKRIKFVTSFRVPKPLCDVYKPYVEDGSFITFEGAVFSNYHTVCWSSVYILPPSIYYKINDEMKCMLGVYKEPPTSKVIQHCHNVAEIIKRKLREGPTGQHDWYVTVMTSIYEFLRNKKSDLEQEKSKLANTPFVIIPEEDVVCAKDVILSVYKEQKEIKPYLFAAPLQFRSYFDIFAEIGAQEHVSCIHYISVLDKIAKEFEKDRVPPNTMDCVKRAIVGLFQILEKDSMSSQAIQDEVEPTKTLFIPNSDSVLKSANELTIADNPTLTQVIVEHCEIDFFLGFDRLEIQPPKNLKQLVKKLPQRMRPAILSEDVEESISTDEMEEVENSLDAEYWETFMRSRDFIEGVIRIIREQIKRSSSLDETYDEDDEKRIIESFSQICIRQVEGLCTYRCYKRMKVPETRMRKACFIEKREEKKANGQRYTLCKLFFQLGPDENVEKVLKKADGIMGVIDICTMNKLEKKYSRIVQDLLEHYKTPHLINEVLDMQNIDSYDINVSQPVTVFPKPGTFVDQDFYPFIVQAISPFKKHEYRYLALDVGADENEESDPVYVYANINKELPKANSDSFLHIKYLVDIGERAFGELVVVPIFKLYKFIPRTADIGSELQEYDAEATGTIPFDENCKRILEMLKEAWSLEEEEDRKHVIKRLFLKWHPDRNRGMEEYATRVFNFIKEVIVKLERGEPVESEFNENTGRTSPDMSSSRYKNFSNRCSATAQTYASGFNDNLDDYQRSTRTGRFSHVHTATKQCRSGEAKRWLKQAKYDFSTAQNTLESAERSKGYNWICYMCHQVISKFLP